MIFFDAEGVQSLVAHPFGVPRRCNGREQRAACALSFHVCPFTRAHSKQSGTFTVGRGMLAGP